jgi:hypothetical protein
LNLGCCKMIILGTSQPTANSGLQKLNHQPGQKLILLRTLPVGKTIVHQKPLYCSLCCWTLVVQQDTPPCTPAAANDTPGQKPIERKPGAANPNLSPPAIHALWKNSSPAEATLLQPLLMEISSHQKPSSCNPAAAKTRSEVDVDLLQLPNHVSTSCHSMTTPAVQRSTLRVKQRYRSRLCS